MRRIVVILGVLAVVASGVALAQTGKREEVANKVRGELKKIDARLKLTADQKTQIKSMLGEEADKLDALYAEIAPRETAIRTEYRGKIRGVLTPAQQAEWDKMKGEYREQWNGKKGEKGEKSDK